MPRSNTLEKKKISFSRLNRKLLFLNAVLLIIFLTAQIAITTLIGTKSSEIENIRKEKDQLRLENEILTAQIDESKSVEKAKSIISKYNLKEKPVYLLDEGKIESVAANN